MYNRAMVQLGICAFRHESVLDSHNCLADLMMSGRVKELLAQGLMPQHRHDRSPEQEKIERSRQVLRNLLIFGIIDTDDVELTDS